MRIISRKRLVEFWAANPEAEKALRVWLKIAKAADWATPAEVRASDPRASIIAGDRVVFDILGGRYRLVVAIHYVSGIIFIRFIGLHAEYDKIEATTV